MDFQSLCFERFAGYLLNMGAFGSSLTRGFSILTFCSMLIIVTHMHNGFVIIYVIYDLLNVQ